MVALTTRAFPMSQFQPTPRVKEKLDEKFIFMATPSTAKKVDNEAKQNGETRSDILRRALELYYSPKSQSVDAANQEALDSFRAPYLSSVPCGPWQEAVDSGDAFTVSSDIADELEAQDGDVWVRADGQSMEGAGIQDGFIVLVRPYEKKTPRRGEIALIQATDADGDCLGTLKRFNGMEGGLARLLDGNDVDFPLPENTVKTEIIGRAVGVVGRL